MLITDDDIRRQLRLGEDSRWEFMQIEFSGEKPVSPRRDDLADELGAFANAGGGILLCGVADDGTTQSMSREQLAALHRLLEEVCTGTLEPSLPVEINIRDLDEQRFVLVGVPRGQTVYQRRGLAFVRVGMAKHRLSNEECLRLAQSHTQNCDFWFDRQPVPGTGINTLDKHFWERLLSVAGAADPRRGLRNLGLLTPDEAGVDRATVAGALLCVSSPQLWLPQATIMATHYRGLDRASGQLDAQEITGPLHSQVADAIRFTIRNMQVAARKKPVPENIAQYSHAAVFEAVVNAVVHRDYSVASRRIRISMFRDRLEIDSPGILPDGMTIDGMEECQTTRNEVIASVLGRIPVPDVSGAGQRKFLMNRRGDGVSIIRKETEQATRVPPKFEIVDGSNLVLSIPAAKLELVPAADATVTVH